MLQRNDDVKFVRDGRLCFGIVRSMVGVMAVVETGPKPVLGSFMAVPISHVVQAESGVP